MSDHRVGDLERDEASRQLSEHYAAGRLDDEEYGERLDAIWSARTNHDLAVLFHDLPVPVRRPAPPQRRPARQQQADGRRVALLVALIGLGILAMVLGVKWWVILIIGLIVAKKSRHF